MDADFPENYVAQLSGHKNLKSLDAFKLASQIKAIRDKCQWCRAGPPLSTLATLRFKQPVFPNCQFKGKKHQVQRPKAFVPEQQLAILKDVLLTFTCQLQRCVEKAKPRGQPRERSTSRL